MFVTTDLGFVDAVRPARGAAPATNRRLTERIVTAIPARLMWKDRHGATRFASVVTRDVSEFGALVECQSPLALSLYRLVQIQIDVDHRRAEGLPSSLKQGRALAAVYRVQPSSERGLACTFALRLMVEPKRLVGTVASSSRATA